MKDRDLDAKNRIIAELLPTKFFRLGERVHAKSLPILYSRKQWHPIFLLV
jgi:hypothetical protein